MENHENHGDCSRITIKIQVHWQIFICGGFHRFEDTLDRIWWIMISKYTGKSSFLMEITILNGKTHYKPLYNHWLVLWNHGFLWLSILIGNGIIIPPDELIFFRGVETTNQISIVGYISCSLATFFAQLWWSLKRTINIATEEKMVLPAPEELVFNKDMEKNGFANKKHSYWKWPLIYNWFTHTKILIVHSMLVYGIWHFWRRWWQYMTLVGTLVSNLQLTNNT